MLTIFSLYIISVVFAVLIIVFYLPSGNAEWASDLKVFILAFCWPIFLLVWLWKWFFPSIEERMRNENHNRREDKH